MNLKLPLPPEFLARVRQLRQDPTDAEKLLWRLLRDRQLDGWKFRRQHPIGKYILDFYCHQARLAIELDGGQHAEPEQARYDAERTRTLETEGIRVLRFWNNDVLKNTNAVLQEIWDALNEPLTPNLSLKGRGEQHPSPTGRRVGDEGEQHSSPDERGDRDKGDRRI